MQRQRPEQPAGPLVDRREHTHVGLTARQLAHQCALAVAVRDDAVGNARVQALDGDREQVADGGTLHMDGAGHHVRAVALGVPHPVGGDGRRVLEHGVGRDAVAGEEDVRVFALILEDALVAHGVDRDGLAGSDAQHGRIRLTGKPPP